MNKHTPGPWSICGGATPKYTGIKSKDNRLIVNEMGDWFQNCSSSPSYDEQRANARLIAAAPLGWDLATMIVEKADFGAEIPPEIIAAAEAFLAKARDGQ